MLTEANLILAASKRLRPPCKRGDRPKIASLKFFNNFNGSSKPGSIQMTGITIALLP